MIVKVSGVSQTVFGVEKAIAQELSHALAQLPSVNVTIKERPRTGDARLFEIIEN
jgi:hypothetical protein